MNLSVCRCIFCAIVVCVYLCSAVPSTAQGKSDDAARLVRALGSDSFRQRGFAAQALQRMGSDALPALIEGTKSRDLEVQSRCKKLISEIEQAAEAERLSLFVRDGLQTGQQPLPSWKLFKEQFGDDYAARRLFVNLYQLDPTFLKLACNDPKRAIIQFQNRCLSTCETADALSSAGVSIDQLRPEAAKLAEQYKLLITEDLSVLCDFYGLCSRFDIASEVRKQVRVIFDEKLPTVIEAGKINRDRLSELVQAARKLGLQDEILVVIRPVFSQTVSGIVSDLLEDVEANNADFNSIRELTELVPELVGNEQLDPIRPIYAAAVEKMIRLPPEQLNSFRGKRVAAFRLFQVGRYLELEEMIPLALRVASLKRWDIKNRRNAIVQVGKLGTRAQIASLQTFLNDETKLYQFGQYTVNGVGFTSRLGDEALAAMIHLSGEELADYGFATPVLPKPTYQDRAWVGWGFYGRSPETIEAVRQAAIKKWKARQAGV